MPRRLPPINLETVTRRLELHPESVTLEAVKAICSGLGQDATTDDHSELKVEAFALADSVQELIDTPDPAGLVASASRINIIDDLVEDAYSLRSDVVEAHDRLDKHTRRATEVIEVLTALGIQAEAADLELRTGARAT